MEKCIQIWSILVFVASRSQVPIGPNYNPYKFCIFWAFHHFWLLLVKRPSNQAMQVILHILVDATQVLSNLVTISKLYLACIK